MTPLRSLAVLFSATVSFTFLSAGIIVDPALATGPDSIDPPGAQDIDFIASGAVPKATLEALPGFGVIQNWTGFTAKASDATTVDNFVRFTTGDNEGLAFRFTLNHGGTSTSIGGITTTSSQLITSEGNALVLGNASGAGGFQSYEITVGSHDGSAFTADQTVGAVSFVLTNRTANVTVTYYNFAGTVLTTQSSAGLLPDPFVTEGGASATAGGYEILFSYVATSLSEEDAIHRIVITGAQSSAAGVWGLDDFGFTQAAIPEPAAWALFGGLGSLALVALRRRRG